MPRYRPQPEEIWEQAAGEDTYESEAPAALDPAEVPLMPGRKENLLTGIAKSFNKRDHVDVTIYIGALEMPAHGVMLAAQGDYFALKSSFIEGKTKTFRFEEGSPHAYWRVFEGMYTGDYSGDPALAVVAEDDGELIKDVYVYALGDLFLVQNLKDYALSRLKAKLQDLWVTERFVDCVREMYSSTNPDDTGLRKAVVDVAKKHLARLWDRSTFRELDREEGDFAVDLTGQFAGL